MSKLPISTWRLEPHWRALRMSVLAAAIAFAQLGALAAEPVGEASRPVDFASEIRPILATHCWSCHGPDESTRAADLRLDRRDSAINARKESPAAIVPGKPDTSPFVARIDATDADERMPPADAKRPLNDRQKTLLRRWIAEGAPYAQHWSFEAPRRPPLPKIKNDLAAGSRRPIDYFIRDKLDLAGLSPAPEASRETLLRRVTLDLTGLPPTLDELDTFLADENPDAYDRVVDRLLSSSRYGERMAMQWLDLARYADTNGYNNDEHRSMWPWRDWVIRAFRRHLPYDQFVVQQLAGDLLAQPTLDQRVATGFNRNHVLTTEGGIIEEEYRVEYVADRVHTTATVFLGLSLQCARCHEHKYDPISQREYYQFFAYFNVLPDRGVGYNKEGFSQPAVRVPDAAHVAELASLDRRAGQLQAQLDERAASVAHRMAGWESALSQADRQRIAAGDAVAHLPCDETSGDTLADSLDATRRGAIQGKATWAAGRRQGALEFDGSTFVPFGSLGNFDATDRFSFAAWVYPTTSDAMAILSRMDDASAYRGYDLLLESGRLVTHLVDRWPGNAIKVMAREAMSLNEWHHVVMAYDGSKKAAGVKLFVDGQPRELDVLSDRLDGTLRTDKAFHLGRRQSSLYFRGRLDDVQVFGVTLSADDAKKLAAGEPVSRASDLLAIPSAQRTVDQRTEIEKLYLNRFDQEYARLRQEFDAIPARRESLQRNVPQVMVMEEGAERRKTRILRRGAYDQPGDEVVPGTPAALPPLAADAPTNRLGLAQWLVAPNHPLTARVAVNRWWEMFFGLGLVETVEDFGTTGAAPSHPELLDWLAVELVHGGWDVQRIQREIANSTTYRQSSAATADARQRDPNNQWLARGARFRLPAESLRDQALAASGLLVERQGGPSVKPYQPAGLWEDVSVERRDKYEPDAGEGLYRKTMYSYWKRTCPPPTLSTFDAPTRETCTIRRARTNTPLQALILLNDPTYVEAARQLAQRALREAPADDSARLALAFRAVVCRQPRAGEAREFHDLVAAARAGYRAAPQQAMELLTVGKSPRDPSLDPAELAAWTIACATLLNLDQVLTKE